MKHANLSIFVPHNGCPNRCVFCNQVNISGQAFEPTGGDVRRLCEAHLAENAAKECEIAFFGGSFTAVRREYMLELLDAAAPFVKSGAAAGIRISTRPDAITPEILDILKERGVTAIELGAQSMDDRVLDLNRRGHRADDVRAASAMIKRCGFSLGLQMMVGMYGESDARAAAEYTANELAALLPDTVRIYPTLVVGDTELFELYAKGVYTPLPLDEAVDITAALLAKFADRNITVIRAGLHADESLRGSVEAGPFHPAFRELCESRIMRGVFERLLTDKPQGDYTVAVAERGESRAIGDKRSNIQFFLQKGYRIKIIGQPGLSRYEAKLI